MVYAKFSFGMQKTLIHAKQSKNQRFLRKSASRLISDKAYDCA